MKTRDLLCTGDANPIAQKKFLSTNLLDFILAIDTSTTKQHPDIEVHLTEDMDYLVGAGMTKEGHWYQKIRTPQAWARVKKTVAECPRYQKPVNIFPYCKNQHFIVFVHSRQGKWGNEDRVWVLDSMMTSSGYEEELAAMNFIFDVDVASYCDVTRQKDNFNCGFHAYINIRKMLQGCGPNGLKHFCNPKERCGRHLASESWSCGEIADARRHMALTIMNQSRLSIEEEEKIQRIESVFKRIKFLAFDPLSLPIEANREEQEAARKNLFQSSPATTVNEDQYPPVIPVMHLVEVSSKDERGDGDRKSSEEESVGEGSENEKECIGEFKQKKHLTKY